MFKKKGVIPKRGEMVQIIKSYVRAVTQTETLPFQQVCNRICASDVYSKNQLPNRPVSRLDGIAVRYGDFSEGPPETSGWVSGREYTYCNTGTAMPEGYDTVIAIEDVTIDKQGLKVHRQPKCRGELVNGIGGSMKEGEILINKGSVIAPAHIGLFASGGVSEVCVYAKPRVGVIPTGDELVPPTDCVPVGKNVESNSYMIAAFLTEWGAVPITYPIVKDDPEAIRESLEHALAENDAAVIIAGSSLGTKDYTIQVLGEIGEVIVPQLAHGPGRKSSLTVVNRKPVLGVAGPPLGAQITSELYLAPFVSALRGLPHIELQTLEVISDDTFTKYEVDFCERVFIYKGEDGYHIRSAFAPKTTRAQMQAISKGNFYREAGTFCEAGGISQVELLCPVEHLPHRDMLADILGKDVKPYE